MKVAICLFVGLAGPTGAVAQAAARQSFPDAEHVVLPDLTEALQRPAHCGGELLFFLPPDAQSLHQAAEAMDSSHLRRWAVVSNATGTAPEGIEMVAPDQWNKSVLAYAIRSAVAQHQLLTKCQRFQGDLRTVAYRISHDLRTPLSAIISSAETLKEIMADKDPDNALFTQTISESVDDLARLIERVSLVTKASVNAMVLKPVPMGEVVWFALQRQERFIVKKGAKVVQPEVWPEVEGVAALLQSIWENLIQNALQHGGAKPHLELGWAQEGAHFRFWLADDGGGVPPERLADLFQPFNLLHRTNARKGLGLSIVQRLLELQNGNCTYEPGPNGGARFSFTLPARPGAAQPATAGNTRA